MASALEHVLGDYHGINPDTLEVERVTRTDFRTLVRDGQEVVPEQLSTGRMAEMEIEDLFGLRDVVFVPEAMRGTALESMAIEELKRQAKGGIRDPMVGHSRRERSGNSR